MRKTLYCLSLSLLILFILKGTASGTPIGDESWSIWWQNNVFQPPTNYIPNPADYPGAVLLDTKTDRTHLVWHPGAGFWENSVFVARTWLYAQSPLIIPVRIAGDDGHSLYVNDNFVIQVSRESV